jgi:biotin carboxyl carrier protein
MKAIVNGERSILLSVSTEGFDFNGQRFNWDVCQLPDGTFHILLNAKNYQAELLSVNWENKSFRIKLNSIPYDIQLVDEFDDLLQKLGMTTREESDIKSVKAPMPGRILNVFAKKGKQVDTGDPLLILNAMKMENIIKSPVRAVIREVMIREGQVVEKNQDLILF